MLTTTSNSGAVPLHFSLAMAKRMIEHHANLLVRDTQKAAFCLQLPGPANALAIPCRSN